MESIHKRNYVCPPVLGLFQKRIDGDDALLRLAALRFREAGLGAELYADTPGELDWLLSFGPFPGTPIVVHLQRGLDLLQEHGRKLIIDFAERYRGRISGLVVHDQKEISTNFDDYLKVLRQLEGRLKEIEKSPYLFVEYAAGLEPELFIRIFKEIGDLQRISACIDIGHIGLWQAGREYSQTHSGRDIYAAREDIRELPSAIEDIRRAMESGLDAVLHVIREIGSAGKPIHFHLHDAHPFSIYGPFGISDHLSFLDEIPIALEYMGKQSLSLMFGPEGLSRIVTQALELLPPDRITFSLEIHAREGRLPLGNVSYLFAHWVDKGNAERMNFWLSVLRKNQELIMKICGKDKVSAEQPPKMIIYNLFPLLAGKFTQWERHFARAADMGFTWVFLNAIQLPGASGSIYSIKDDFAFNPLLVDPDVENSPQDQVKEMIRTAEDLGLKLMTDLVINHCAVDSPLIKLHPQWFLWQKDGRVAHPFADENGKKVIWRDLAKFDHKNTKDKEGLFQYFFHVVEFLIQLGFKGFRCDAAYQIPKSLWERLISETKRRYPGIIFFAETLGSPPDLTRRTAGAGFDYIFNSSKWWDFSSPWLMEQYNLTREIAPSISFSESHDTMRLCEELNGNIEGLKQRYLFSALFSAGVMVPMGFEFGFRKRLHVVKTRPEDWETTDLDLTSFIREVNSLKAGHPLFQEDAPTEILHYGNSNVLLLWKASIRTQEEALLILNKDISQKQHFYAENIQRFLQAGAPLMDMSPGHRLDYIPMPFSYDLHPGQGIVLMTSGDSFSED
jgi:starch synthase (maltosyl-transferring)